MKDKQLHQSNKSHFLSGFYKGMSSTASLFEATPKYSEVKATEYLPQRSSSDLDSLRSDWLKIGAAFNTVISREQAKNTAH